MGTQADDALIRLGDSVSNAIRTRQLAPLMEALHDDVVLTVMTGEMCAGRQAVAEYFKRMLTGPGHLLRSMDTRLTLDGPPRHLSDDVVVGTGRSETTYVFAAGRTMRVQNRFTATLVHEDGWRIAAFHWSANVFDNPILNGVRRAAWWTAAGGLVLGLWLGWRLGRD